MLKPIKEAGEVERLKRALMVIEGLTYEQDLTDENPFVNTVYRIAHAATGVHTCPHDDWLAEIEVLEKELKEANIVDVEKELIEPLPLAPAYDYQEDYTGGI